MADGATAWGIVVTVVLVFPVVDRFVLQVGTPGMLVFSFVYWYIGSGFYSGWISLKVLYFDQFFLRFSLTVSTEACFVMFFRCLTRVFCVVGPNRV